MALSNEDLEELVETANVAIGTVQREYGRDNIVAARIRFPRGYLHTAESVRRKLPNIGTEVQRRNVTYALMNIDALRWLVTRTDISGTALSMIVKNAICILGTIVEWMTKEGTRGHASRRPYLQRTAKLAELGRIDATVEAELNWIWDIRCREHIHESETLEHDNYTREDYNRALRAFKALQSSLIAVHGTAV